MLELLSHCSPGEPVFFDYNYTDSKLWITNGNGDRLGYIGYTPGMLKSVLNGYCRGIIGGYSENNTIESSSSVIVFYDERLS